MQPIATKDSWEIVSMPRENEEFILKKVITKQQYEVLKRGHVPREMEDKWFWYFEEDTIYIHRSWTGYCVYIVNFNLETHTHKIVVNRDSEQYKCTSIEEDRYKLDDLLNWFVEEDYDYYNEWLSETVNMFNVEKIETVFEILGIENKELPISNLLAWYFEDREFLNKVLKLADIREISKEESYEVRREYHIVHNGQKMCMDILIRIGDVDKPSRVICIENKINSEEGNMQTKNYYDTLEEIFRESKERDYIYLTKNNSSVNISSGHFIHIKYRDVGEILREEKFREYRYAADFCEYYIDREEREFSKTPSVP
ncbi:MAG: PD-(D/E)XK nuclease family protein [Oscillospiraceae bacterium]|nr:PD-(D/E)XK nuclease family protein [Oscillospiraceae bacterium]